MDRPVNNFDVLVVGAGPSSMLLAALLARRGLRIGCLAPQPDAPWPNNYGVWLDELQRLGLEKYAEQTWQRAALATEAKGVQHLERAYAKVDRAGLKAALHGEIIANKGAFFDEWVTHVEHLDDRSQVITRSGARYTARVVVDAGGHGGVLTAYEQGAPPAYQAAYGIRARVSQHPWASDEMLLMDFRLPEESKAAYDVPTFLYTMPLSPTEVFVEETSLVRAPALGFDELERRLRARLARYGISLIDELETERCLIPMGRPLPLDAQRVIAFGGAASLVHPATGYMFARVAALADPLAETIATALREGQPPHEVARQAWELLWPNEQRRTWQLLRFGMDVSTTMNTKETSGFFATFFTLSHEDWRRFLASELSVSELSAVMMRFFARAPFWLKRRLMAEGLKREGRERIRRALSGG